MPTLPRATRLDHVAKKATNVLAERLPALRARGLDPINLATARPDFDTPAAIKRAAHEALDVPVTYILYTESRGLAELREAVAAKLTLENGVVVDPDSEVIVTAGTHEALTIALLAVVEPGDEVLLIDPSWVAYAGMVQLTGARPIYVPLAGTRLDPGALEASITPRTRALLFNNPNNPTGTVFTRAELEAIAEVAQRHDLLVIVDEIYEHFVYDGRSHVSIASLDGMRERTLTVNGVSKAYAMTGWRVGWAAGPASLVSDMLTVHQHVISSPCAFAQKGAVAAYTTAVASREPMIAAYARRRSLLAEGLRHLPHLEAPVPEGACFFLLDVSTGHDSAELSEAFLERAGLMLTPGAAFGPSHDHHLRLSFAGLPERRVPEVLNRMEGVLTSLGRRPPPTPIREELV